MIHPHALGRGHGGWHGSQGTRGMQALGQVPATPVVQQVQGQGVPQLMKSISKSSKSIEGLHLDAPQLES